VPVQPQDQAPTKAAIQFIESNWGVTANGWRATGSVPDSDHPKGLAADVVITSRSMGDQIAQWFIDHAGVFGTKYVIWQRRIWTPSQGWHPYSGPSPHTDHVHISFNAGGGIGAIPAAAGNLVSGAAGGVLNVAPLVGGIRNVVVLSAFAALGLGLVAAGAWRGFGGKRT